MAVEMAGMTCASMAFYEKKQKSATNEASLLSNHRVNIKSRLYLGRTVEHLHSTSLYVAVWSAVDSRSPHGDALKYSVDGLKEGSSKTLSTCTPTKFEILGSYQTVDLGPGMICVGPINS